MGGRIKIPQGDRTGPRGEGPLTGKKRGYGVLYDTPQYNRTRPNPRRPMDGRGEGLGNRPIYRYPECYRTNKVRGQETQNAFQSELENITLANKSEGLERKLNKSNRKKSLNENFKYHTITKSFSLKRYNPISR